MSISTDRRIADWYARQHWPLHVVAGAALLAWACLSEDERAEWLERSRQFEKDPAARLPTIRRPGDWMGRSRARADDQNAA